MVNTDTEASSDSPGSMRSLIKLELSIKNEESLNIFSKGRKSVFFKEKIFDNGLNTNYEIKKSPKLSENQKSPAKNFGPKPLIKKLNSIELNQCERDVESSNKANLDIHL